MAETVVAEKPLVLPAEHIRKPVFANGKLWTIFSYAAMGLGALISLGPFVWMILKSFMSLGESIGATFIPTQWHLENYARAWRDAQFSDYLVNSVLITLITLAGELTFSVMAAYAFARIKFPGREILFALLLSSMMIPGMVTMIPNLLTVTWLGRVGPIAWIDNWPALTIPFMGSVFSLFLLRQFFVRIPEELFDAAKMDGANEFQVFRYIILPLLNPVTLSAVIILGHISLKIFDLIVAMSGKDLRLDVPSIYMWTTTFDGNNFARGAAIGILMLLGVALLVVPYLIYTNRTEIDV